jgi:SAM-dependent methyltransferase
MSKQRSPADYDPFAWVYNKHWGGFSQKLVPVVESLVLNHTPRLARVLDLCCGTGQLACALQARGYEVTGVDASSEMIRLARVNAPDCRFLVEDARAFTVSREFDAVFSVYDSLNHIVSIRDLRSVFRRVHGALRVGGHFLFDLNMEEGFRERWRGSHGIVEEDHVCVVRTRYDAAARRGEAAITLFRREDEWSRRDLVLIQRCYEEEEVTTALEGEGLTDVRVLDARRDLEMPDIGRSFFLCSKPGAAPRG